jgi:AhpD family alkylhydroperoxidase
MKKITVPTLEQLDTNSQHTLNLLSKRLGSIPNLYATIGYSSKALDGLLNFEAALINGAVFSGKDREAVNLIVSEVNHCNYCLAAHTLLAMKRGFTKEETLAIRRGELTDQKLNTVLLLSRSISENKGYADPALLEAFFDAGYNESALMELIGLITIRTFTNYVYALTDIPIDFPPAP